MSLSYCRFQNVIEDLKDCLQNIHEELSEEENAARDRLMEVCKELIEEYDGRW